MKKFIIAMLIISGPAIFTVRAGVDDVLSFVSEKNVEGYLKPFVTSLGVGLNSGMYHSAMVPEEFSYGFTFRSMLVLVTDDQKTFKPYTPEGYSSESTATVYGGDPGYIYGDQGYISYPGGFNVDRIALAFPQIILGWKGTELTAKFTPVFEIGESKEEFYFYTFALKHEITRYFSNVPFNGAIQFGFGKIKFSDQLDFSNMAFNLIASKDFKFSTLYGGLSYQKTEVEANYSIVGDPENADPDLRLPKDVSLTIDGENGFGITAGAALRLGFFVLNADYTYNSQSVITAGMSFQF